MTDVFAIQDEIAEAITRALKVTLAPGAEPRKRYTPPLPAYEAYLKARSHRFQLIPEALEHAKKYYEQAIQLDPNFALAHSELGFTYISVAINHTLPAHEAMPAAQRAAARALEIDPSLPEANAMLGVVAAQYDYDWAEAERRFQIAMSSDPVAPEIRHLYGYFCLAPMGRFQESVEQHDRAIEEDPLNLLLRLGRALCLWIAGRFEEAQAECRTLLEMNENFPYALFALGSCLAAQGRLAEALPYAEKAYSLAPLVPALVSSYAQILAAAGDRVRAEELVARLESAQPHSAPWSRLTLCLGLGEVENALNWVERGIEERTMLFALVARARFPALEALRAHPRWPALARKFNLP
jgi:serine/threonine-protein kinase